VNRLRDKPVGFSEKVFYKIFVSIYRPLMGAFFKDFLKFAFYLEELLLLSRKCIQSVNDYEHKYFFRWWKIDKKYDWVWSR